MDYVCREVYTKIQDHLHELYELSDKLHVHVAVIGEEVAKVHKVDVLLHVCSVQDRYLTLVTALLARGESELTLNFFFFTSKRKRR